MAKAVAATGEYFIHQLDLLQTLEAIKPLAFPLTLLPQTLKREDIEAKLASIDTSRPGIIHPMRELIRQLIDPKVGDFAPGWSVDGPTTDVDGFQRLSVVIKTPETGAINAPRRFHARTASKVQTAFAGFAGRCSLEVNNGTAEGGWHVADLSEIIDAANTGEQHFIALRAKDIPDKDTQGKILATNEGSALKLLGEVIVPIIKSESWEDLVQAYGTTKRVIPDIVRQRDVFKAIGSGTGMIARVTFIYAESIEAPPPKQAKIKHEELAGEIELLRHAHESVLSAHAPKGAKSSEAKDLIVAMRRMTTEVAAKAEELMLDLLPLDIRSRLAGAKPEYRNAQMAVHETVDGILDSGAQNLQLCEAVRDELLTCLRGKDASNIWMNLTKGESGSFALLSPKAIPTSEIPLLIRAGFVGAATPDVVGGMAQHLFVFARNDLFPVLTSLFGIENANGWNILGYGMHQKRFPALIVDNTPSKGGAYLVIRPDAAILESFGVAGNDTVKFPLPTYQQKPNNKTADGHEVNIRATMDNFKPNTVKIICDLGLNGVGLSRLESELRYIGDGWKFTPGNLKSRTVLEGHLYGALKQMVAIYERESLPENRDYPFWIRAPDIVPSDPNKRPAVLRAFYTEGALESIELLLQNPNDLLKPAANAIRAVQDETGHRMAMALPHCDTNEQLQQARSYIGEGLGIVPVIESKLGVANMETMDTKVGFLLGVNDITEDATGKGRGEEGYDQLDPRVLILIRQAKGNAVAKGVPLDVCSYLAEEPAGLVALIGLGIREISVPPVSADETRKTINRIDSGVAEAEVDKILEESKTTQITAASVRERLERIGSLIP